MEVALSRQQGRDHEVATTLQRKPAGGFQFIRGKELCVAWWAYHTGRIKLVDLRAWLACQEVVSRRCQLANRQAPRYELGELQQLLGGVTERSARACVRRLKKAKLLEWSESQIRFLGPEDGAGEELERMLGLVKNIRRRVPFPRRLIRYLARDGRRSVLAVAFGHALRCLYYDSKRAGCKATGSCKASWVAEVFGIHVRRAKEARKDLVELGWLEMGTAPQWYLNRYGARVAVNLHWAEAVENEAGARTGLAPPPAKNDTGLAPPESDIELSQGRSKNQKPACSGRSGVLSSKAEKLRGPRLSHVVREDLEDVERLLKLFEEAIERGLVSGSPASQLQFVAAAEHARAVGGRNPPGLFAHVVRKGLWHHVTQDAEDAASRRLKRHLYPEDEVPDFCAEPAKPAVPVPELSRDARLFVAVEDARKKSRIRCSGLVLLRRKCPEWTLDRWEQAKAEFESWQELRRASGGASGCR